MRLASARWLQSECLQEFYVVPWALLCNSHCYAANLPLTNFTGRAPVAVKFKSYLVHSSILSIEHVEPMHLFCAALTTIRGDGRGARR